MLHQIAIVLVAKYKYGLFPQTQQAQIWQRKRNMKFCDSKLQVLTDELQRLLKKWQNDVSLQQRGNRFVM